MRGSPEERAAVRASFKRMNKKEKAEYILTYYRLPLFTAFVVIVVLISSLVHHFTKKESVLYLANVNIVIGETMTEKMSNEYLTSVGKDPKRTEVLIYHDLYIDEDPSSENHQYAYASKLKILGAISSKRMDLALMNKNGFEQMSASGLLLKTDVLLSGHPELYEKLKPYLTEGTVILEDNSIEYDLNEADTYEAVTEQQVNAFDVSDFPIFRNAGMDGKLYIAVIANTTHPEEACSYLEYLLNAQ